MIWQRDRIKWLTVLLLSFFIHSKYALQVTFYTIQVIPYILIFKHCNRNVVHFCIEGETNAGKSTFLNLVLGEKDLLTVKAVCCTSVITRISYGTNVSVCVLYESGNKQDVPLTPGIEVNKQVEKLLYEHDLTLRETTERTGDRIVEVHLKIPSKILKVFEQFYLQKIVC